MGATCVHGVGGAWGMLAMGLFGRRDNLEDYTRYDNRLLLLLFLPLFLLLLLLPLLPVLPLLL